MFTHTVADGPEEGTYEIHITGNFDDVSVTGTVDGEPVDSSEVPDFASMEPIDVTVVVDDQGNVISAGGEDLEDPLGGMLGDLGPMGGGAPGTRSRSRAVLRPSLLRRRGCRGRHLVR